MIDQDSRRPDERQGELRAPYIEPVPRNGGGRFYLVAGVLVALVLAVGVLFYDGGIGHRADEAQQPVPAMPGRPASPPDIDLNKALPGRNPEIPEPREPTRPLPPAEK